MKVIEYQINPKLYRDLYSEGFFFKPPHKDKKHLGELYFIGEIYNFSKKDKEILQELAQIAKHEFYRQAKLSPEDAFKQTIRILNRKLKSLVSKGEIKWLGNFNLALLNVNNFSLIFSKSGTIKILLLRNNEVIDLGENLESQTLTTGALDKFFPNFVAGKIFFNDKIFVLTQLLFEKFSQDILEEILSLEKFNLREIKKVLRGYRKELRDVQGIFCLIIPEPVKSSRLLFLQWGYRISRLICLHKKLFLLLGLAFILGVSYLIFKWGQ